MSLCSLTGNSVSSKEKKTRKKKRENKKHEHSNVGELLTLIKCYKTTANENCEGILSQNAVVNVWSSLTKRYFARIINV